MRAQEFIPEGIIDFVKRSLGFAWGRPGDVVRGRVVADYLENNTHHSESTLEKVRRSQFQLKNINTETAKQYRSFTDQNASGDVLDVDKMDRARARKITYDSLVKNPPVLDRDGFIWDGNHRIQQAIESGLSSIPVLIQTKGEDFIQEYKTTPFQGLDISLEQEADELMVRAMAGGRELGSVLFVQDGEYLLPQDLEVDERYRGQGIAAAMYDYVKSQGYQIRRSGQQTDAGYQFWEKHRPGSNVWEDRQSKITSDLRPQVIGISPRKLDKLSESAGSNYSDFDRNISRNLHLPQRRGMPSNTMGLYGVYLTTLNEGVGDKKISDAERALFEKFSQRCANSIESAQIGDSVSLLQLSTLDIPGHRLIARLGGFLSPKEIIDVSTRNNIRYLKFSDGSTFPDSDNNDPVFMLQQLSMTRLFDSYTAASKAYSLYALEGQKISDQIDFSSDVDKTQPIQEQKTQWLYHATYRPLLASIQKHGLGGSPAQAQWEDSEPGVVYLAVSRDIAESYAEANNQVPEEWLDKIVILKIDASRLDPRRLKVDRNVQDNTGDTLEYHGVIPVDNFSSLNEVQILGRVKGKGSQPSQLPRMGRPIRPDEESRYLGRKVVDYRGLEIWRDVLGGQISYTLFVPESRQAMIYTFGSRYPGNTQSYVVSGLYAAPGNPIRAAEFYRALIQELGLTLVSDRKQSPGGQRVWQQLEQFADIEVYGYDTKTGETLNISASDEEMYAVSSQAAQGSREMQQIARDIRLVATAR